MWLFRKVTASIDNLVDEFRVSTWEAEFSQKFQGDVGVDINLLAVQEVDLEELIGEDSPICHAFHFKERAVDVPGVEAIRNADGKGTVEICPVVDGAQARSPFQESGSTGFQS